MEALIEELMTIIEDDTIPKNVKIKLECAVYALKDTSIELSLRTNKALQELDDLSNDQNVPSYMRPQLWNIISQLETK